MGFRFEVDDKDINFLKRQWDNLSSFYTSDKSLKNNLFQIIRKKYSEKSRFYHNLSHVSMLLFLYESLSNQTQNHHVIEFSIWLHDVIYDTKRTDNESESAKMASEILAKLNVNTGAIELVKDLILATTDHNGRSLSSDAKLFLDMDLAILGMDEEIYKIYSQAIRKEYAWVSESAYRKGRTQVLQSFLERDRIYFTDEMKAKYEEQARKNIAGEIKALAV